MQGSPLSLTRAVAADEPCASRNLLAAPIMAWVDWSDAFVRADSWLDEIHQRLRDGQVADGMAALYAGLHFLRRKWDREEWHLFCLESTRAHPIRELLHQCPYSRHSFLRPRGYAGDADLIDFVYSERSADASPLGQSIYHFLYAQPGPQSVRERRIILSEEIDAAAERVHHPRILSVACGHLREAEHSRAVAERRVGELIAFDQDNLSLAEVTRQHPGGGPVHPVCDTVRSIVLGRRVFRDQDLVYSAGLYDYLNQSTAQRLTRQLFNMLRSGGRLVVANFAHNTPDAGYLEAFMDWWLVYRDEEQMRGLTAEIDPSQIASLSMRRDSVGNVIYLTLERR
jgi:extracellular factor (EF) 3-hydroxypalmitic acid methyl ester biosynthesis protein